MSLAERILFIFIFARAEFMVYRLQHLCNICESQETYRDLKFSYIQVWLCHLAFDCRENFNENLLSQASVYSLLKENCLLGDVGNQVIHRRS